MRYRECRNKLSGVGGWESDYQTFSVIFLDYKHILICVHKVHIAYQPISAQIYYVCSMCLGQHISLSTTSSAASWLGILCVLQSCQPTYILVHYKWCSWLASNIMCALNVPANIYPSPLQEVQLISWEYCVHFKHASRHTEFSPKRQRCQIFTAFLTCGNLVKMPPLHEISDLHKM